MHRINKWHCHLISQPSILDFEPPGLVALANDKEAEGDSRDEAEGEEALAVAHGIGVVCQARGTHETSNSWGHRADRAFLKAAKAWVILFDPVSAMGPDVSLVWGFATEAFVVAVGFVEIVDVIHPLDHFADWRFPLRRAKIITRTICEEHLGRTAVVSAAGEADDTRSKFDARVKLRVIGNLRSSKCAQLLVVAVGDAELHQEVVHRAEEVRVVIKAAPEQLHCSVVSMRRPFANQSQFERARRRPALDNGNFVFAHVSGNSVSRCGRKMCAGKIWPGLSVGSAVSRFPDLVVVILALKNMPCGS